MSSTRASKSPVLESTRGVRILMFHKPKSVVVTRRDELGRRTIYDVLPEWVRQEGWVPIGRLDRDSRGLLLLVEDSHLVERLGAAGSHFKTYEIWIRGRISSSDLQQIQQGVPSPVGTLRCVSASVLRMIGPRTMLRVTLEEGKNRHLRRMFGALQDPQHKTSLKVLELKRVGFGSVNLDISSGRWRFLTSQEVSGLLAGDRSRTRINGV